MIDQHHTHVLVQTLAWTLIHFLWQGALIGSLLWLLLAAMGTSTARVRYLVRCAALGLMSFAPLATFVWLWGAAPPLPSLAGPSLSATDDLAAPANAALEYGQLTWICGLWLGGALLCVLRISGGLLQISRLRRRSSGAALAPRWQRRFEQLAREFGVRARARLVQGVTLCVPVVIGYARPIVLLPARLFSGLSDEQIEALLAHELAHIARNDYFVNIVQSIVESLLFYHPAVWWVSRGIRVEREYCCDDLAVAATHNGLAYAHALTALESWRGAQPQLGVSTLGGSLMDRIQRLLGVKTASTRKTFRPANAFAGLLAACTLSASAFAFSTLPEPSDCDCKCACHEKQANEEQLHRLSLRMHIQSQYRVRLEKVKEGQTRVDLGDYLQLRRNKLFEMPDDQDLHEIQGLHDKRKHEYEVERHQFDPRLHEYEHLKQIRIRDGAPAARDHEFQDVLLGVIPQFDEQHGVLELRADLRTPDLRDTVQDVHGEANVIREQHRLDFSTPHGADSIKDLFKLRELSEDVHLREREISLKQELSNLRRRLAKLERELDASAEWRAHLYQSQEEHE